MSEWNWLLTFLPGWYFKRASYALPIFSHTRRVDFIGACNDIRAFITDQGLLSMSVLVSDDIESEENEEK